MVARPHGMGKVKGSSPFGSKMKIFVICSKRFYSKIADIKSELESCGHVVELPNSFDNPEAENGIKNMGNKAHAKWKEKMFSRSLRVTKGSDAVLVLNFDKDNYKNYIGGATFLEMYDAFRLKKKIFLYNQIPEGILKDEIICFSPIVIEGNLKRIK